MYGVTEEEIISLNPGSETVIRTGEQLRIPVKDKKGNVHTVVAGETLYSLARNNGITIQDILDANPGIAENGLKAGQTIVIPVISPNAVQPDNMDTHIVQKGETIYKISKK